MWTWLVTLRGSLPHMHTNTHGTRRKYWWCCNTPVCFFLDLSTHSHKWWSMRTLWSASVNGRCEEWSIDLSLTPTCLHCIDRDIRNATNQSIRHMQKFSRVKSATIEMDFGMCMSSLFISVSQWTHPPTNFTWPLEPNRHTYYLY